MKAVAKYPGSKWSLTKWIIGYFPEHHSYLEPFFGSGAVLFNKPRSNIETVNDLDGNVVNLFECIKEDPQKLASMIYFTPYAREVYGKAYEMVPDEDDKFEKALNFYIRLNMGHGFRTSGGRVGWKNDVQGRERAYAAQDWCSLPEKIMQAAERLRGVQIDNRPAEKIIDQYNHEKVLQYWDPPYMLGTRHGKQYRHEMSDRDHESLLGKAIKSQAKIIISGYDSELYNDMLKDWYRCETVTYSQAASKKWEVLWMNYEPPSKQMSVEDL